MDQVDLAIAKFKRHTTIGRIKSLDDLFLSAHYRQETTGYIPGPGATKFTLLLDSVSPNLIHKPSGQNIVVEITPALQQLIESTLGYQTAEVYGAKVHNPCTSFTIIGWPKDGVALIKANRIDHLDLNSYLGFIDIQQLADFKIEDAPDMAHPKFKRTM